MTETQDISKILSELKNAQTNLDNLRNTFKENEELLSFYESSAIYIVQQFENQLKNLLEKDYNVQLTSAIPSTPDFWIRIEGKDFHNGKGPINFIGNFLNKFHTANKQLIQLINEKTNEFTDNFLSEIMETLSFDLVATDVGSLKLGLKNKVVPTTVKTGQMDLFNDPWQDFLKISNNYKEMYSSVNVLLTAILSTEDDSVFTKLKEKYEDKHLLKIMYYAKELTPTNKSGVEFISFEGSELFVPKKEVKATYKTRKLLHERVKDISKVTDFIEGTGRVGAVDIDTGSITIRQLYYGENQHDELKCKLLKKLSQEKLKSYLGKYVEISGYIFKDKNGRFLYMEIDEISEVNKN